MNYQVNEMFVSLQGEGTLTGSLATFIRLQGCPVGCSWCDSGPLADDLKGRMTNGETRNTWGVGGTRMSAEELIDKVSTRHVIITGGEPVLYNLDALIEPLRAKGHFIQIETSGLNDLKGALLPDWITWSPKENLKWDAPPRLKKLCKEVKWVVDENLDPSTIVEQWLWMQANRSDLPFVVLMPEGCPPKLAMVTKAYALLGGVPPAIQSWWRFGDRLQYRLGVR